MKRLAEAIPVHLSSVTIERVRAYVETALREVKERSGIPFAVRFAGGGGLPAPGNPAFPVVFKNPRAYWRIALFGHLGFLESYFDGDLDIEGSLAKALAAGMQGGMDRPKPLVRWLNRWHEFLYRNSNWGRAPKNAEFHYALGPEFYKLWLDDPLMFY